MNATTVNVTEAVAPRVTAHSMCDHDKTKGARAACRRARRSGWVLITREDATKGAEIKITTDEAVTEGVLLGWGAKRIVVRTEEGRVNINTADVIKAEGKADTE